jgi:hypothetical protein
MLIHHIYILHKDSEVLYVGKTVDPQRRLKEHRYYSWRHISDLKMQVIDSIYENESGLLEQCYIRKYRLMGYTLAKNRRFKNPQSFPDYLVSRVSRPLHR